MRFRHSYLKSRKFRLATATFSLLLAITSLVSIPNSSAAACTPETTISGSYTIVAFKTVGTCTWSTPGGTNSFRGLIVGGGGGGGYHMGGGGGGGGYVEFETLTITNDVLTIVVGDGGAGATTWVAGSSGGNSSLTGSGILLTARGGAGGATDYSSNSYPARTNGGSGGGSSGANDYPGVYPQDRSSLGTQTSQSQTPSLSSITGNQFGGNGVAPGGRWNPSGGGGAGGDGANTPATGGVGKANSILGTNYYWAGGGGGSGYSTIGGNGGAGGGGGGGSGNISAGTGGTAGANGLSTGTNGAYIGGNGGANTGGGGGGGTYSTYAGGNGGSGIVVLRYLTFASPTSFTSSVAPYTNTTSPITFSLTFSQNVSSVANTDFTNAGTATGCSFSINASSGTTFTLTATGCSEGTLIPQVLAGSVYGTVTGTNGPTSDSPTSTPVTIDRTSPTISSVTAPANATYIPTNTPTFTVNFSESVTVTGTPRLTLTVGAQTKYANYLSMSDSKTALFRYTVGTSAGEFDTDGIAVSTTLDLNGGSIADLATNALSPLTFTTPTLTSVLVAQKPGAPTIDSVTATSGTLTTYFTAGASNGAAISNYEYSTDNGSTWKARASGTTASPIVITTVSASATSLTNGTTYSLRIRAVNAAGSGDSSTAVSAMPSAVVVSGDSSLTLTYGSTASTSTYTATGGTGSYTYTLSSTPSGVSISAGVVTASGTTAAGTYTQNVQATDGNSQVGLKQLVITVNKATTSITIALPNNSSNAALGGAVTITATVPQAGQVNFKLGGTTISGCGTASAASTIATCSWTPGSLGGVSLTAVFTPTDSSNYETSTSTTLSITVVNGTSSVTLSLTGGITQAAKGNTINIIAAVDQAGKLTILIDGKRLVGCFNISVTVGNKSCVWKPAVQKQVTITATLNPTNSVYNNSSAKLAVWVIKRTGTRS
jgi:fibronectin-binding autotransporter adhesin